MILRHICGRGVRVLSTRTTSIATRNNASLCNLRSVLNSCRHNNNNTCLSLKHNLRQYSQQPTPTDGGSKNRLIWLVYFSGCLGGVLLIAVLRQEYHRYCKRKRGIQELQIPSFGHRVFICRYKDTMLFDTVGQNIEDIEKFVVREDDIWLVGWPRSGNTWTQEIVYLVQTGLNFEGAKSAKLDDRFPYLEFFYPGLKTVASNPSPRLIKSHLPFQLLPSDIHIKKPKIIYVSRNPKDVIVSYYHFIRMLLPFRFKGKFPEFFTLFMNDQLPYSPWWKHVKEFWEHKEDGNILFLKYEDTKKDPHGTVRKIAIFLGKSLTEDQVSAIADHCSFSNMKVNEMVNHLWFESYGLRREGEADFIRKGQVGDWKNYMTPEMSRQIDKLVDDKLSEVGLTFESEPQE